MVGEGGLAFCLELFTFVSWSSTRVSVVLSDDVEGHLGVMEASWNLEAQLESQRLILLKWKITLEYWRLSKEL